MDLFVKETTQTAFFRDGVTSSHPVFVPVSHPDEIDKIFDSISYSKVYYFGMTLAYCFLIGCTIVVGINTE